MSGADAGPHVTVEAPASARRRLTARFGLAAWRRHHRWSARVSWQRLWAQPLASLLTIALTGLALALPLLLVAAALNLGSLGGRIGDSGEISVFLKSGTVENTARQLAAEFGHLPGVAGVTLNSPDDGLAELTSVPEFAAALDALGENPLPYVLLLKLAAGTDRAGLLATLAARAEIELIQYDQRWRERLQRVQALLDRLFWLAAVLIGAAVLMVVGANVRSEVQSRAEEIRIVLLLGGSAGFVRRPFLWSGFWLGWLAALVALLILWAVGLALAAPVDAIAASYGTSFQLRAPGAILCLSTIAAGVLLGCFGAWLASSLLIVAEQDPIKYRATQPTA